MKAIIAIAKKFGLSKYDVYTKPILEMCHLALLPNSFVYEGFQYVANQLCSSPKWDRFCSYYNRQWVDANVSVYGLKNRTNNFSESLNKSSSLVNGKKPHNHKNFISFYFILFYFINMAR